MAPEKGYRAGGVRASGLMGLVPAGPSDENCGTPCLLEVESTPGTFLKASGTGKGFESEAAMNRDDVLELIRMSLESLNDDVHLLVKKVNERAITAKLGSYLQGHLPAVLEQPDYFKSVPTAERFHVDCEYNKHGDDTKKIHLDSTLVNLDTEEFYYTPIPDIIVHQRGPNGINLLSVEVKKDGELEGLEQLLDKMKVVGYIAPNLRYHFGIYLCLGVEDGKVTVKEAKFGTRERVDAADRETARQLESECVDLINKRVTAKGRMIPRPHLPPDEDHEARQLCARVEEVYGLEDITDTFA